MSVILTFILFVYGNSPVDGKFIVVPIAEFDKREDCETIREGLSGFKVSGSDMSLICLENTETHKLTQQVTMPKPTIEDVLDPTIHDEPLEELWDNIFIQQQYIHLKEEQEFALLRL